MSKGININRKPGAIMRLADLKLGDHFKTRLTNRSGVLVDRRHGAACVLIEGQPKNTHPSLLVELA